MTKTLTYILSKPSSRKSHGDAFTLIELLIAFALLLLISSGTISLVILGNNANRLSKAQLDVQSSIDSDLSQIRKRSEDYTCCAGSPCTSNPTLGSSTTCQGPVNSSNYYFPSSTVDALTPTVIANINNFVSKCSNLTLLNDLVSQIGTASFNGVTRTPSIDNSSSLASNGNVLNVSYVSNDDNLAKSGTILRSIKIIPTVANWCP